MSNYVPKREELPEKKSPLFADLESIVAKSPRFKCKFKLVELARRSKKLRDTYNKKYFQNRVNELLYVYEGFLGNAINDYSAKLEYVPLTIPLDAYAQMKNIAMEKTVRFAQIYGKYKPTLPTSGSVVSAAGDNQGIDSYLPRKKLRART